MTAIKYTVDIQVAGGPRLNFSDTLTVDAYDRIDVVVPGADADAETVVDVQPGAQPGAVKLLLVKAKPASDSITFANGSADVGLQNTVLLSGGAVGILADVPQQLTFKNGSGADATVMIFVGRDAT
ncbi:MAG: hypothetical protein QOJ98_1797, partial [Acidobacteriota bacterium]|nr:hypothetical protein [Acidobacteriota bacterium]